MKTNSSRNKIWIVVGVSTALLLFLFAFFIDLGDLVRLFKAINWWNFIGVTAVLLAGYIFLTIRLRYILLNEPGWEETFYANSIGFMYHIALFVPAMVARVVAIGMVTPISMPQAYSALLVERLLEQVMRLSATILVVLLLSSEQTHPTTSIGGTLIFVIVLFGAIFWTVRHRERVIDTLTFRLSRWGYFSKEQIRSTTSTMLQSLDAISSGRHLMVNLLLSYAAWISFFIFHYLVLAALPLKLSTNQMLLIAAAVLAVMPPSVNVMLVVYHVIVIVLLVTFQLTNTTVAATYAIILHLIQMICWTILGMGALRRTGLKRRQIIDEIKSYLHKGSEALEAGNA
ncbi:MAG: flippase-like domain-containing protein [Chloroflexi bacterium]|nr:flippase-like domain-containing protein [Chloroflexota bacterium]